MFLDLRPALHFSPSLPVDPRLYIIPPTIVFLSVPQLVVNSQNHTLRDRQYVTFFLESSFGTSVLYHALFISEQAAYGVLTKAPQLCYFTHREMTFQRAHSSSASVGHVDRILYGSRTALSQYVPLKCPIQTDPSRSETIQRAANHSHSSGDAVRHPLLKA
jgi:hypothetical protein